jgi:hypothetical protein
MKVLDYEQVNGDQDKYDLATLPPSRSKHYSQQETKYGNGQQSEHLQIPSQHQVARRPVMNNDNISSYMHGGHIPSHLSWGRTLAAESRASSGETTVGETQQVPVDDLSLPERMV